MAEQRRNLNGQGRQGIESLRTMEELISRAKETLDPEREFVQMADGESLCARDYFSNLNRISNMFVDVGMKKQCHAAVFLPNCLEYSYLYPVLGRLGIVIVPINQFLKGDVLRYLINHSDIEYLITNSEQFREKIVPIAELVENVRVVILIDEEAGGTKFRTVSFKEIRRYPTEFTQPWEVKGTDIQGIWYTSGTTGLPKGVMVTQEYTLYRTLFSVDYFRLTRSDVVYILPMYHSPYTAWGIPMVMAGGCKIVSVKWFTARKFWEHVARYNATVVLSAGTIIPILRKQEMEQYEIEGKKHLRLWIGWPVDEPNATCARWPETKFLEAYGQSEYGMATVTSYDNPQLGSAGLPTPYTELKICDPESGKDLAQGQLGEIVVRSKVGSKLMMLGYYKSPEETKKALRDGWCHSGDLGYVDEKGLLHFVDRLGDSVRVSGENIPSAELEAIIRKHPKIHEVAIVGVKGELGHDEIVVHIVLEEGAVLSSEEFFEFFASEMAYFMIPKYLCIQKEFPKTASLKVEKYKLRQQGIPAGSITRQDQGRKKR
jgi:crotonobetaine/carnitine-CoA ligase